MTGSGKSIARVRLLKKIGIIGLSVSAVAVAVIAIVSFLPKSSSAFSVRIDNDKKASAHFTMSSTQDGSPTRYLSGNAVKSMAPTSASRLEQQLKTIGASEGGFQGQQNWVGKTEDNEDDRGLALIYTVYLANSSETEDQKIYYNVDLDGYNKAEAFEYFRVVAQTQIVGEDEIQTAYYGNARTMDFRAKFNTVLSEEEQDREPISLWGVQDVDNPIVESNFSSNGNDGYCISFNSYLKSKHIVENAELVIPKGKTMRFTYASYFEGEDFDSDKAAPNESLSLLLSLHFGV